MFLRICAVAALLATTSIGQAAPLIEDEAEPAFHPLHMRALRSLMNWCPSLAAANADVQKIRMSARWSLPDWEFGKLGWEHYLQIEFTVRDNSAYVPPDLANNPRWISLKKFLFFVGGSKNPGVTIQPISGARFYCRDPSGDLLEPDRVYTNPSFAYLAGPKGLDSEWADLAAPEKKR